MSNFNQQSTKPFSFNTGRYYGPEGQFIEVTVLSTQDSEILPGIPEHRVQFVDQTRHVRGVVNIIGEVTQRSVMAEYDAGRYE